MKGFVGYFVILVLVVCAQSVISVNKNKCTGKNAFLSELAKHKVVIHSTVNKTNHTRCQQEWKKYGSCCDYNSLAQYAIKDKKSIAQAVSEAKMFFPTISKLFIEMVQLSEQYLELEHQLNEHQRAVIELFTKNTTLSLMDKFSRLGNQSTFIPTVEKCWKKMIGVRSNSLCPVCSGRSEQFFSGPKALLSEQICRETLESCAGSFHLMFEFIDAISESFEVFQIQDNSSGQAPNMMQNLVMMVGMQVLKNGLKDPIILSISQYMESNHANNTLEVADLCSKVVSLSHAAFITKVSKSYGILGGIFRDHNTNYKKLMDGIEKNHENTIQARTLPTESHTERRLLGMNLMGNSGNSLKVDGDVMMLMDIKNGESHTSQSTVSTFYIQKKGDNKKSLPFDPSAMFP